MVTDLGEVKVLGTQFNVQSNKEYIEVHCFEGKVRVNGITYKPYKICELPTRFGCINYGEGFGISEWLHLPSPNGGLTYIIDES